MKTTAINMKTNLMKNNIIAVALLVAIFASFTLPVYGQLPPKVELARLQRNAEQNMASKNWAGAIKNYEAMPKLGLDLPNSFYYDYARALEGAGAFEDAKEALSIYLTAAADEGGSTLDAALALYTSIENSIELLKEWDGPRGMARSYVFARRGDPSEMINMGVYYWGLYDQDRADMWGADHRLTDYAKKLLSNALRWIHPALANKQYSDLLNPDQLDKGINYYERVVNTTMEQRVFDFDLDMALRYAREGNFKLLDHYKQCRYSYLSEIKRWSTFEDAIAYTTAKVHADLLMEYIALAEAGHEAADRHIGNGNVAQGKKIREIFYDYPSDRKRAARNVQECYKGGYGGFPVNHYNSDVWGYISGFIH